MNLNLYKDFKIMNTFYMNTLILDFIFLYN